MNTDSKSAEHVNHGGTEAPVFAPKLRPGKQRLIQKLALYAEKNL